ncbi:MULTISPECIES: serine/threonine-protein kinase [Microbacterium]|uniref:serine/threonine-protein kinase n=1 Tax=Microbacterium TaxID=33882 RepID=UPI00070108BC|nr:MULTISPECIES: serine/threonine-protein kinase [unclassified Microbacterium]MBN9198998.1 protein kinase [Microbacterium ginsengisoli]MCK9916611.1 serine/threonine-protein kinase [Microbacteriaceae bacterium K1510]KQR92256.1 hypothetical protein ASG00_03415 [Microbacterium sp. Leaf351]KQR92771.1 hypothetical protein ASF93_04590 [Microbacterium sp. Leaf347]OJU76215.1 MAG: hypothetical protein BGO15_05480 [Microbacterium sp. 71-23]
MTASVVGGRYRIGTTLGSGGTATVYEAHDEQTDRVVALKLLHSHLAKDNAACDAFFEEVAASSAIPHPAIVTAIEWGVDRSGDVPVAWIAMELVPGVTLAQHVRTHGPLRAADTVLLADALLSVVAAAHDAGVVHRDISPSNVMVDMAFDDGGVRRESVRLLDFGLADVSGRSTHGADPLLSAPGAGVVANVPYASPEHLTGASVTEASDVYQIGAVLWFALTGGPPFAGDRDAVSFAHRALPPPRLGDALPGADPTLERILVRALAKQPDTRYAPSAMRSALRGVGRGAGSPAPAPRRPSRATRDEPVGATALLPPPSASRRGGTAVSPRWRRRGAAAAVIAGILVTGAAIVGLSAAATPTAWGSPAALASTPPVSPTPSTSPAVVTVTVPDVVGLSRADAIAGLERAGLHVGRVDLVDAAAAADTVVASVAAPGARVVAGVSIDLRVASGNNLVPDVRGLDASTAGARLTAAGFPSAVVSGGSPGDLVIVYAPQGSVPLGTAVSLTVAPASVPTPTPDAPPTPSASPSATPTMSPTPTVMPTPTR